MSECFNHLSHSIASPGYMAWWIEQSQDMEASSPRAGWICQSWNVAWGRTLPHPSNAEAYRDTGNERYWVRWYLSGRYISYSRGCLVRFQMLHIPDIVLLPLSLSHLPELWVSSFGRIANSVSIAPSMNSPLQTMIVAHRPLGNGDAGSSGTGCFHNCQRSMHTWQDNIAASDRQHKV